MQCTGCSYKVACCHLAGDLNKVPCSFVSFKFFFPFFCVETNQMFNLRWQCWRQAGELHSLVKASATEVA